MKKVIAFVLIGLILSIHFLMKLNTHAPQKIDTSNLFESRLDLLQYEKNLMCGPFDNCVFIGGDVYAKQTNCKLAYANLKTLPFPISVLSEDYSKIYEINKVASGIVKTEIAENDKLIEKAELAKAKLRAGKKIHSTFSFSFEGFPFGPSTCKLMPMLQNINIKYNLTKVMRDQDTGPHPIVNCRNFQTNDLRALLHESDMGK